MVISRTPLRVGFVGGGSDLLPFAHEHGGAVLSTTIDKYIHVLVTSRFEDSLRVSYSKTEIVDRLDDVEHELVREALRVAGIPRKVEIVTVADVPAQGTGLGSSSAVVVGVLNALFAFQGILKTADELAHEAARIEIDVLGKPIGRQDHWAAAHGGLQLLWFGPGDVVRRDPVVLSRAGRDALERKLLMFYTGQQRAAGDVLGKIQGKLGGDGNRTEEQLARKRDAAIALYSRLAGDDVDFDELGRLLHEDWLLKRSLDPSVSNDEIDGLYETALAAGALGGKLLGAGGGGFLLFYVPEESQAAVRSALRDLRELAFRFEQHGSRIVFIDR
jgi:D-glycero-alpha-D-manno-heptose-7-phosphate kinase